MREIARLVAVSFIPLLVIPLLSLSLSAASDTALSAALAAYERDDYTTAYATFNPIAKDGEPVAQFALGVMYENGQGVHKDYPRALYWYRKAAQQGYARAQNNLGLLYATGQGAPLDYVRAYMWYSLAAAQENAKALENRHGLARWMRSGQIAEAERLAREFQEYKASQAGAQHAVHSVALDHEPSTQALEGIQTRLASLGYEPGPIDGILGPKTTSAIRAFQQDAGLPVDGKVSSRLTDKLSSYAATATGDSLH